MTPCVESPDECDCCNWGTTELHAVESSHAGYGWGNLCGVCYSTPAGNTWVYPENYERAHRDTLRMLAWQTNYLAAHIAERVPSDDEALRSGAAALFRAVQKRENWSQEAES